MQSVPSACPQHDGQCDQTLARSLFRAADEVSGATKHVRLILTGYIPASCCR
jgi:hypothetical protein